MSRHPGPIGPGIPSSIDHRGIALENDRAIRNVLFRVHDGSPHCDRHVRRGPEIRSGCLPPKRIKSADMRFMTPKQEGMKWTAIAISSIHGDDIEPGTSEVADAIAGFTAVDNSTKYPEETLPTPAISAVAAWKFNWRSAGDCSHPCLKVREDAFPPKTMAGLTRQREGSHHIVQFLRTSSFCILSIL